MPCRDDGAISSTAANLDAYLATCSSMSREQFFQAPPFANFIENAERLEWDSPVPSGFPANDRTRVHLYCPHGPISAHRVSSPCPDERK